MRESLRDIPRNLFAALFAAAVLLAAAAPAGATDLHVETTGTDSGACGPVVDPCLTIAQATTNAAASGDRVLIGPGTFTQTAPINPGAKSIEYVGSGPSSTTVTGASSNSFPSAGLFAFRTTGTTVAVRDLEVAGIPDTDATGSRFGIWVQPQPANPANVVNATIDNVKFTGVGTPPSGIFETAVYASNNNGSVTIQNCTANDLNGNVILLESQEGAVSVSGSSFTRAAAGSTVIFDTMHDVGATNYDQTGLHSFTNNTFSARSAAITVVGGWPFGASPTAGAFPVGVTISGNTIDTGGTNTTGVTLVNATRDNTGTAGRIDNAVVSGNTIAAGTGSGIVLQGGIPDAQITGNIVRGRTNGISLTRFTGGSTWDHKPDGAAISANQIVGNTTGVSTDSGVSVTADLDGNWWGCNAGPDVAASPTPGDCDGVATFDAAALTLSRWVVLGISASQPALAPGGSSAVTAGFDLDNLGGAAPQVFADGTTLPLSASGGGLDTTTPTLSASLANATFTSSGPAGRSVSAMMDNQTVTFAWPDHVASPPIITIAAPANGAVVTQSSVVLSYTVDQPATCSPPSGSTIPLSVGANTILVTCTNANGEVGVAGVTVTRPDALPQCARAVVITNVQRSGSQTKLSGFARIQYAGQRITLQYEPSGSRTIARPVVQADGSWRAVVHRPTSPAYNSNRARYRAILADTTTSWIKLTRRMGATSVTSIGGGRLKVAGSVSLPIAKGQPLRVQRSDACGNYRQVGWLRVWGSGTFSGTIADGGASDSAVFIRLKVAVQKASNPRERFNTYSIVQPVVLTR